MSSHLHAVSPVKLSLTVNWEDSKGLILLNSASFFKNLMHFNASIMLCKAELTCWHHTAIHALQSRALLLLTSYCYLCSALLADTVLLSCALLSVKQSWLTDIILSSCVLLCLLASYCYLMLCFSSSRVDSLTSYCHLMFLYFALSADIILSNIYVSQLN